MIYKKFKDIELSTLGMGNMRLPAVDPKDPHSPIDWPKAHEIIDYAYSHGVNYFDTAYVYNNGESEKCLGECMKKYPRDSFYIATKFNYGANPDYKEVFETQLERLQTDYIDFYLLHCLLDGNIDNYLNCGCIDYFLDLQKQGKIKYLGFSSHAGVDTLERFASHHQWDFAQIQLNYFDWNYAETAKEYQILADHGIPTMVMEPVRGGRLAKLNDEAEALLKAAHPDWSTASWALRFANHLDNTQVILSGMSDMDQVIDNVNTFSDGCQWTSDDEKVVMAACDSFHSHLVVPCTACRYCTETCPSQINIPEFMKAFNAYKTEGRGPAKRIISQIETTGTPADCITCGQCTQHCPQGIDIPGIMAQLAEIL